MIDILIKNIIRFVFLILLQVGLINNIELSIFLSPMLIVLFIILLPVETPKWLLLVSSFFLGLIVDIFMNSLGILAFSAVLVAYLRPFYLLITAPRDGYEKGNVLGVNDYGWDWFLRYAFVLTFIMHFLYFLLVGFKQENFLVILWQTIISSFVTLLLITVHQLFVIKK